MNIFKFLFLSKEERQFLIAEELIKQLNLFLDTHVIPKQKMETKINEGEAAEEYQKFYIESIDKLPTQLQISHRHLLKLAVFLRPSLYSKDISRALSPLLDKANYEVSVFGNLLEINNEYIRIYDFDEFDGKKKIFYVNAYFTNDFAEQLKKYKKEDYLRLKVKIPMSLKILNAYDKKTLETYKERGLEEQWLPHMGKFIISDSLQDGIIAYTLGCELCQII